MSEAPVVELFCELAAIPSPSRHERAVMDRCLGYLRDLGLEWSEDEPPAPGDEAGNVLVRLPATPGVEGTPLLFCSHVDTVPPTAPIEPVIRDGMIENAHDTILGGDNKAAVASMLEAIAIVVRENRRHAGIELLLTVQEETGLTGAKAFDASRLAARAGYVYDHADRIGRIVTRAPSQYTLEATITGRPAHSGIAPEDGRSAIVAAAKAIGEMSLGRVDAETTANVGLIAGGVARNIVPARCTLSAEARSLDHEHALRHARSMLDTLAYAANAHECELTTSVTLEYRAYRLKRADPVVAIATRALAAGGFEVELIASGGGADSHVFTAAGIPCANLCNGMRQIHTSDESIAVDDVVAMVAVTLALIEAAQG